MMYQGDFASIYEGMFGPLQHDAHMKVWKRMLLKKRNEENAIRLSKVKFTDIFPEFRKD